MGTGRLVCGSLDDVRIRAPDFQDLSLSFGLRCQPGHAIAILFRNVPLAALRPVYPGPYSDSLQYDLLPDAAGDYWNVYEVQEKWCYLSIEPAGS